MSDVQSDVTRGEWGAKNYFKKTWRKKLRDSKREKRNVCGGTTFHV